MSSTHLTSIVDEAKSAYHAGQYDRAAQLFNEAARQYSSSGDALTAAEMSNNESVAWLRAGKAREALNAATNTDQAFANINDAKRQAIALSNQAAALEGLKEWDKALALYEQASSLFADIGESDMRSAVLKSIASIKLRRGKITESAFNMMGSLESKQSPSVFERILRFFLRFRT